MTTRSKLSSVSKFLENKIHEVSLGIEYSTRFQKALTDDDSKATKHERNVELKRAERKQREATRELVTLKWQKKLSEDDIVEGQGHNLLEAAYAIKMLNRDRIPRPLNKTERNRAIDTQEAFRKDVKGFYEVTGYSEITAD